MCIRDSIRLLQLALLRKMELDVLDIQTTIHPLLFIIGRDAEYLIRDVYKRQRFGKSTAGGVMADKESTPMESEVTPVSYTHLDVYKRQM